MKVLEREIIFFFSVPDRIESLTFGNKIDTRLEIFWTPPRRPNGVITGGVLPARHLSINEILICDLQLVRFAK